MMVTDPNCFKKQHGENCVKLNSLFIIVALIKLSIGRVPKLGNIETIQIKKYDRNVIIALDLLQ